MKDRVLGLLACLVVMAISPASEAVDLGRIVQHMKAVPCNGTQYSNSFAFDYFQQTRFRSWNVVVVAAPSINVQITFSEDGPTEAHQTNFGGVMNADRVFAMNLGGDGYLVQAAQAMALEWACSGGGTMDIIATYFFSA